MNHIAQTVAIHKEKVARREIGVLTANKVNSRQYKIVAPSNPEKPIKYIRKPIDYSILDDIGHGMALGSRSSMKSRSSMQSSNVSMAPALGPPPPTTKPPTPPQMAKNMMTGTLRPGNTGTIKRSEYRTPPVVVPPQVPSHYAPGMQGRRPPSSASSNERGPDYRALPMANPMPPSQVAMHHMSPPPQPQPPPQQLQPQIGMVHPMQNPPTTTYEERNSMPRKLKIFKKRVSVHF